MVYSSVRRSSKSGRRPAWVNKELLPKLNCKKKVRRRWKERTGYFLEIKTLAIQERNQEHQSSAQVKMARDIKSNKGFLYIFLRLSCRSVGQGTY